MLTLLSFIIGPPPDPPPDTVQLINTELDSTPLTVLTVQLITRGLPTITPCIGPGGDMVTVGLGTMCNSNENKHNSSTQSLHTIYIQCDTIIGH